MTWYDDAACAAAIRAGEATADDWFPDPHKNAPKAKAICASCPVQAPCLEAGDHEHGVWGGLSESERKQVRRMRRRCARCKTTLYGVQQQRYCDVCAADDHAQRQIRYRARRAV